MTYQTTVTTKGQMTIPKALRNILGLDEKARRVTVEYQPKDQSIKVKPALDFLEVARRIKPRRKMNVLKAREFMERNYERA